MNDKPGYCDHHGTQVGMPCPFCGRINMNPTPTPPKTHAEVAEDIVNNIEFNGLCPQFSKLRAAITTALREAYERGLTIGFDRGQGWAKTREGAMERAGLVFDGEDKIVTRSGTILDDAGNVRRVLGTLRHTLDGAIVLDGQWVYYEGNKYLVSDGKVPVSVPLYSCGAPTGEYRDVSVEECYSTKQSALHAKDAHAGEKGAAHEG